MFIAISIVCLVVAAIMYVGGVFDGDRRVTLGATVAFLLCVLAALADRLLP